MFSDKQKVRNLFGQSTQEVTDAGSLVAIYSSFDEPGWFVLRFGLESLYCCWMGTTVPNRTANQDAIG